MILLDYASIPLVGSSKKMTEDPPINAIANDNFLLLPPLNSLINLSLSSSNSVTSMISLISYCKSNPSKPLTLPMNISISITFKET